MSVLSQILAVIGPLDVLGAISIGVGGADILARRRARRVRTKGARS